MGLNISVFRAADRADCTNNGISARFASLCVVNVPGPFEPTPDTPAVILESHRPGIVRLVPATFGEVSKAYAKAPGWYMAGGNFGSTSDSRFGEAVEALTGERFYGAVAIHDRKE